MPARGWLLIVTAMAALPCSAAAALVQETAISSSRAGPVAPLNRLTFGGNVLTGDRVDHWVVLFCVDWYRACEEAMDEYIVQAEDFSRSLNQGSLWRDVVRFASVDCAVDKVLCNEQLVDTYPMVAHYAGGTSVARRRWSRYTLAKWFHKDLLDQGVAKPLLTDEERALALRVLASFGALVVLFLWSVSQGADLWLYYSTMRAQQPTPRTPCKREREAPCQQAPAEPSAAPPSGGVVARRLPQDRAQERGSLFL